MSLPPRFRLSARSSSPVAVRPFVLFLSLPAKIRDNRLVVRSAAHSFLKVLMSAILWAPFVVPAARAQIDVADGGDYVAARFN